MKPILTVFILSFSVSVFAQAQTKAPAKPASATGDCFKQWYSLFKERGAEPVPDGVNDVIMEDTAMAVGSPLPISTTINMLMERSLLTL